MSVLWILQFVSSNVSILKATTIAYAGKVTRWTRREFVKVAIDKINISENIVRYTHKSFGTIFISDVYECSSVNNCQQDCENAPGSYNCSCYEGFELSLDGKSCNGRFPVLINKI